MRVATTSASVTGSVGQEATRHQKRHEGVPIPGGEFDHHGQSAFGGQVSVSHIIHDADHPGEETLSRLHTPRSTVL